MNRNLRIALNQTTVVAVREHPELRSALRRAHALDEVCPVLPGVWASSSVADDWRTRIAAVATADPDAVIAGEAARALIGWRSRPFAHVDVYRRGEHRPHRGFRWVTSLIPEDLIVHHQGIRRTSAALTALDLIPHHGGDAIDEALREGVPLTALWAALDRTPGRRGNRGRRLLLEDSRDEPWSEAERLGHQLLRAAGLAGWRANVSIMLPTGKVIVDVLFERHRLIIEFDGYEHHGSREMFHKDRLRDLRLAAAGWTVLRVTWPMLTERPEEVVAAIRGRLAGGTGDSLVLDRAA